MSPQSIKLLLLTCMIISANELLAYIIHFKPNISRQRIKNGLNSRKTPPYKLWRGFILGGQFLSS